MKRKRKQTDRDTALHLPFPQRFAHANKNQETPGLHLRMNENPNSWCLTGVGLLHTVGYWECNPSSQHKLVWHIPVLQQGHGLCGFPTESSTGLVPA